LGVDRVARLSELGEFGFIERLRRLERRQAGVDIGIGDDCAVVRVGRRRVLLTTDALVEGVHFRWSWDRPAGLGRRAFLVNASDVAAMGGTARFALLSLAAPRSAKASDLDALVRGFAAAARENGCVLVGGNLSASRRWVVSATLVGEPCGEPIRRSGARVSDEVWVSGSLGGAAYGREILLGRRRGSGRETLAFRRPPVRLELGSALARSGAASAAIDLSDGLVSDLGHICRASGVGAIVEISHLPYAQPLRRLRRGAERLRLALAGGEDYELLFTAPAGRARDVARLRELAPITAIGRIVRGSGVRILDPKGAERTAGLGFDHFRGQN
jgi:thiamine-monophosphate kinase